MVDASTTAQASPSETSLTLETVLEHQLALEKKMESLEQQVRSSSIAGGDGKEVGRGLEKVGVFWDVENCSLSTSIDASAFVQSLLDAVSSPGQQVQINAYYDVGNENGPARRALRGALEEAGVVVRDCTRLVSSKKDVADHRIMVDAIEFVADHPGSTLVLISGDADFAYLLSRARMRGSRVVLVATEWISEGLRSAADSVVSWKSIVNRPSKSSSKSTFDVELAASKPSSATSALVAKPLEDAVRSSTTCPKATSSPPKVSSPPKATQPTPLSLPTSSVDVERPALVASKVPATRTVVHVPEPTRSVLPTALPPCFTVLMTAIVAASARWPSDKATFSHVACFLGPRAKGKQPYKTLRKLVEAAAAAGLVNFVLRVREESTVWLLRPKLA